ncbi:MAG: inorganic triphosphatase, partial [Burkholderiales bacterium]|nr:inorganic triphosphatase [Burkholderiales bacterium]
MLKDREIELKLAINPADVAAFRRLPLLRELTIDGPKRRKVSNVYFDTPELELKQHGIALRLRKMGGKWLQTLKTAGTAVGGLHQRGEWELPLRAPQLDLALFAGTPLAELSGSKKLHLMLRPAFTTNFYRTTWQVEVSPGQLVEVALDQGVIRSGESESVISEVEIELIEGRSAAVFDMASSLFERIALRPERLRKAERGYRLFHPEPLVARRAVGVKLKRKWSPLEAMLAIVAACLSQFDANVEGALASDDPEYIHQLRVSLRRLRSAMRIFKPADAGAIGDGLKWLAATLGTARDWDVLVTASLPTLLTGYGDASFASAIMGTAKTRQVAAREAARAALVSTRQMILAMSVGRWISVAGELAVLPAPAAEDGRAFQADAERNLTEFASHEIRRHHRRLLRVSMVPLAEQSAQARHQV